VKTIGSHDHASGGVEISQHRGDPEGVEQGIRLGVNVRLVDLLSDPLADRGPHLDKTEIVAHTPF
jgi:hypothetical protein